ncbi:NADP-dependent oxidoreductase [Solimicrobium silvestre]|uniref:Putative NADP-dependent oxidoreductase n=1 Tax=Solimicrobium silvestre TaxID=2099400 RepID=A0A2S9GUF2_9BURK|nr:NADP-dependent oxidoreductase [Solimicrobium silvestre]PRC91286.1 putative NADP-dependent oxidoreductase [Solimicrobium silvestre]
MKIADLTNTAVNTVTTLKTFQRIVLAARPKGRVSPENFRMETLPQLISSDLAAGEVLVRNHYLSLDPYMRGRMSTAKSYSAPQELDHTMLGATAGVVVASRHAEFSVGDSVVGHLGWAEMGVTQGNLLRQVDAARLPLSVYLGVVGMPGVTAWYGVNRILQAQAGQTLVVSAASGAVGSVVGQLAKLIGCRVVGIAGGEKKCSYVVDQLGFDACVDYKANQTEAELLDCLRAAAPDGIDLLFENVGSSVFDASLACLNPYAKIALCGMIAGYNSASQPLKHANKLLTMRAMLQGFIVTEHMDVWPQALTELAALVASGQLKYHETIAQGLAAAPDAFIGLLSGQNLGKQLVKLS